VTLPCYDGGESEIWFGGTDDEARVEKILGTEYSTIFLNEISQISWNVVTTIWTRLAENVGLRPRMYYDCNPPFKRHWSYTVFFKGESPDGEPLVFPVDSLDPDSELGPIIDHCANLRMNPTDNPHLGVTYMGILRSLPERARKRYLEGLFLDDVEGALWSDEILLQAKLKDRGTVTHLCVAWDPATTNEAGSDEHGIILCGRNDQREAGTMADHSGKMHVSAAAQKVVNLYREESANCVVVETNQGGDMCEAMIHHIDPSVRVIKVHASRGKFARAEPVAQLYVQGKAWHSEGMPELDDQLTTYVPIGDAKKSPDRLDALVWGVTYLCPPSGSSSFHFG